jgi:hypothetical protein
VNNDLKIGHVRLQLECVCDKCGLRSNVKVDVRTHSCNSVYVWWGAVVVHMQVSSYATPCLRSNVHDTFERRVRSNFFFFFKKFTK